MNSNNDHKLFWDLVVRVMDGQANDVETRRFREVLLTDEELMDSYLYLKNNWQNIKHLEDFDRINPEKDWEIVRNRITGHETANPVIKGTERKRRSLYRILPYAAAIVVLAVLSILLVWQHPGTSPAVNHYTKIEAPMGSKSIIELPDGSNISLNAGSSLIYRESYNVENRELILEGEAFFEVADMDIPFVVNAQGIKLIALGTSFNVKAYIDDEYIEATLVSGSLMIEKAFEEGPSFEEIILEPNQKATFFREEERVAVTTQVDSVLTDDPIVASHLSRPIVGVEVAKKQDITAEISWKDGVIVVEGEPLHQLVRRLERRYNVEFVFLDDELKSYRYSGRLRELTLEQVLQAMKLTSPIDYTIDDQVVTISENPLTRDQYPEYY